MSTKQRAHITAAIGTILLMVLLWLLLWFIYLGIPRDEEEDLGVEVAFGQVEEAGGYESRQSESVPLESSSAAPAPAESSQQELMTQEDEAALALQQQRDKEERQRREADEAERKAREQAAAEKKAREEAIAMASAMGSLFGGNSVGAQGSGDSKGQGQKGNPVGHGNIGGHDWSLGGREAKSVPSPSNTFAQEGQVVVQIQVNAAGKVVSATVGAGTTISDKSTQQLALDAARRAVFTEGDQEKQVGTITYHFKFK